MDPQEKASLADAASTLVEDADAKTMYTQLLGVLEVASKGIPVQLVGRPAVRKPLHARSREGFQFKVGVMPKKGGA